MTDAAPNTGAPGVPSAAPGFTPAVRADPTPSAGLTADYGDRGSDGASGRPASTEAYELALPSDFAMPQGAEVRFDPADAVRGPVIKEARALAHELGINQKNFSRMLALQAKLELAQHDAENARVAAAEKQLGSTFPQRKAEVLQTLNRRLPQEAAKALAAGITTAEQFAAIEMVLGLRTAAPSSSAPTSSDALAEKLWPRRMAK